MTEQWEVIQVVLKNGKKIRVIAECVIGDYAVHQRIFNGKTIDDGYTITHVISGVSVYTTLLESEARKVAKAVSDLKINPITLKPNEYTKLLEQLHAIAPRHVTNLIG